MSKEVSKTDVEITMQVMAGWYMQFCQSKHYSKLKKIAQKHSEKIIIDLLSLMFYKFNLKPDDWSPEALEEYCHETLVDNSYHRGEDYFKSASDVFLAFFKYLDEMKLQKNAKLLIKVIKEHDECIMDSYYDMDEDEEEYSDDESNEVIEIIEKWLEEFIDTKYFLEIDDKYKDACEDIIFSFADFMYGYTGLKPEKWNISGLEEICLDVMPRKVMADEQYFESIAPSLTAFFSFMEEKKLNKNSSKLAKRVKDIGNDIVKASKKSSNWGIGKQILGQALDKGIDLSDKSKLTKFLNSMMGKPLPKLEDEDDEEEETLEIERPDNIIPFVRKAEKVGRNDPCTCGSGKKYKKCCGK